MCFIFIGNYFPGEALCIIYSKGKRQGCLPGSGARGIGLGVCGFSSDGFTTALLVQGPETEGCTI